ncbi:MAG: formylglycine-generating enzyme family protein [Stigonema ocellatum SAG 48.90 = DSM 106950]|nr:formylglycine-generating enzyme family protein [Stigonema ocellatum SAG 48.90 = DSM 106950]
MGEVEVTSAAETPTEETQTEIIKTEIEETTESPPTPPLADPEFSQPSASVYLPSPPDHKSQSGTAPEGIPFKAPAAPGLRNPLALARALRPLMRKVSSQTKKILDEEETVRQFAEKRILIPVLKPAPERWLDLALVVEESRSIVIWQEIIAEFQKLTELQGAFRSVSTWSLQTDEKGEIKLFTKQNQTANQQSDRSPKELLDIAGRRLVLLVSDCTSGIWHQGKIHDLLKLWSSSSPLVILQLFPERLWMRTAMGFGFPVQLNALAPGVPNTKLTIDGLPVWEDVDIKKAIILPVVTLEPDSLQQWSRVVAGVGSTQTAGILFETSLIPAQPQISKDTKKLTALELVNRFRATASPTARRLAGLMATVPVSLPVVHLIQETLLKESMQVHVAEVFMSGILQPITVNSTASKRENVNYEFVEGVRDLLIDSVPTPDVDTVLEVVSQYIARKVGLSIKNFAALLSPHADWDKATQQEIIPFAEIATQVLRRLGGEYAALAEQLEQKSPVLPKPPTVFDNFPPLQTYDFKIANITIEDGEIEDETDINLQLFEFEVATIEVQKSGLFRRQTKLIIKRRRQQAYGFIEYLGDGIALEMVQIPGGNFIMGAPKNEKDSRDNERPQHQVTISPFFLGKYPVTQAQWQAVAALPQVNRELNPDPSRFKGENRPVEQVSWYDASEFCDRLSRATGKPYRLPSEAEWEYPCRAGTTTPFHFGETITSELANYNGEVQYGPEPKGTYRGETTDVGSFGVANAFGLYDMHGLVLEWCADHWHVNYEGAPTDGSAWLIKNDNDNQIRVLRGGAWNNDPVYCRSACRSGVNTGYSTFGFRVVCGLSPRILSP